MTQMSGRSSAPVLRIAVLALAGIETVLFLFIAYLALSQALSANEQLGRSLGWAIMAGAAVPYVPFALPALILGILGRWLKLALLLAVLAIVVAVVGRSLM